MIRLMRLFFSFVFFGLIIFLQFMLPTEVSAQNCRCQESCCRDYSGDGCYLAGGENRWWGWQYPYSGECNETSICQQWLSCSDFNTVPIACGSCNYGYGDANLGSTFYQQCVASCGGPGGGGGCTCNCGEIVPETCDITRNGETWLRARLYSTWSDDNLKRVAYQRPWRDGAWGNNDPEYKNLTQVGESYPICPNWSQIRWDGDIRIPQSGNYVFRFSWHDAGGGNNDDGEVRINGNIIINDGMGVRNVIDGNIATATSNPINLSQGWHKIDILLQFRDTGLNKLAHLQWTTPYNGSFHMVPYSLSGEPILRPCTVPNASIDGPIELIAGGAAGTYSASAGYRGANSGEIWSSPQSSQSWSLLASNASFPRTATFACPTAAAGQQYHLVTNAYRNTGTACTGNPFLNYNSISERNTSGALWNGWDFYDCGPNDVRTVTCIAPTPTPRVRVYSRDTGGTLRSTYSKYYAYNNDSNARVRIDHNLNVSSYVHEASTPLTNTYRRGGGICLNTDQIILGVTPVPVGLGVSAYWTYNTRSCREYVWDRWATGTRDVTFVVATITPAATPTPTPYVQAYSRTPSNTAQSITYFRYRTYTSSAWSTTSTSSSPASSYIVPALTPATSTRRGMTACWNPNQVVNVGVTPVQIAGVPTGYVRSTINETATQWCQQVDWPTWSFNGTALSNRRQAYFVFVTPTPTPGVIGILQTPSGDPLPAVSWARYCNGAVGTAGYFDTFTTASFPVGGCPTNAGIAVNPPGVNPTVYITPAPGGGAGGWSGDFRFYRWAPNWSYTTNIANSNMRTVTFVAVTPTPTPVFNVSGLVRFREHPSDVSCSDRVSEPYDVVWTEAGNMRLSGTYSPSNLPYSDDASLNTTDGSYIFNDVPQSFWGSVSKTTPLPAGYEFACPAGGALSVGPLNAEASNLNFYIRLQRDPWWQVVGGDVGAMGSSGLTVLSQIPGAYASDRFIITFNSDLNQGVLVTASTTSPDFGGGDGITNPNSWWASSPFDLSSTENYEYFRRLIIDGPGFTGDIPDSPGNLDENDLFSGTGTYHYSFSGGSNNVEIETEYTVSAGTRAIHLIDGNVEIKDNVIVDPDGFVAFIVSGNIEISEDVSEVHGVYVADGEFKVKGYGLDLDIQFNGQGMFVGWDSVDLERDLPDDITEGPGETFTYRPDLIINAPDVLRKNTYFWQELAP